MLPAGIARQVITILRPVTVLDHNVEVPDWNQPPAETVTVPGCSVQPTGGSEDRARQDELSVTFSVWAPVGTTVGAFDRVLVDSYPEPLRLVAEVQVWAVNQRLDHVVLDFGAWKG